MVNHCAVTRIQGVSCRDDVQTPVIVVVTPGRRSIQPAQAGVKQLEIPAACVAVDVRHQQRASGLASAMNEQVQIAVVVKIAPFNSTAIHIRKVEIQLYKLSAAVISINHRLVQTLTRQRQIQVAVVVEIAPGHAPASHPAKQCRYQSEHFVSQREREGSARSGPIGIRHHDRDGGPALNRLSTADGDGATSACAAKEDVG